MVVVMGGGGGEGGGRGGLGSARDKGPRACRCAQPTFTDPSFVMCCKTFATLTVEASQSVHTGLITLAYALIGTLVIFWKSTK